MLHGSALLTAGVSLPLSLAVLLAITALTLLLKSLSPLLDQRSVSAEEWVRLEDDALELLRRRDRLVDELRELEFEAKMDKLDGDDLSDLRQQYRAEALSLMRALDQQQRSIEGELQRAIDAEKKDAASKREEQAAPADEAAAEAEADDQLSGSETTTDDNQREESRA
ncbi:MAG: hypothetical protein VYD19_10815 [Myxococcota bacterium]|nr:hypothetical protein [Myxococcota bacterium]